jgi:hypothetical protein
VLAGVADIGEVGEPRNVHEERRAREAQLHGGDERVPASEQLCVLPPSEELERVLGDASFALSSSKA